MNFTDIAVICYVLCFLITAAMIFFERRDPVVSMAWALCFAFLPFVGLLLFLVFGLGLKAHTKKTILKSRN